MGLSLAEEELKNQSEVTSEEMENPGEGLQLLLVGVDSEVLEFAKSVLPGFTVHEFKQSDAFFNKSEEISDNQYVCAVVGSEFGTGFIMQAAQLLKCQCPTTPLFYLTHNKTDFNSKFAKKHGFDYVGLFPMDKELMEGYLLKIAQPDALGARAYKPIKIFDLNGDTQLSFDTYVFLPLNNRTIKFSHKDRKVGESRIEKLKSRSKSNLYIHINDVEKFYDLAANWLKDMGEGRGLSETERLDKLEGAVRSLFTDIFDTSEKSDMNTGRAVLETCKNIVSTYITGDSKKSWYQQMLVSLGGSSKGFYSATDVSTISALIAMGTQMADPMDVAIAGLMRDISLSDFSSDLLEKPQTEWDDQNKNLYLKHPQLSVNVIKEKKMILTRNAETAILQHEERYSGMGFPKQLSGDMISIEAQILVLAEQFYNLTREVEGETPMLPMDALQNIRNNRYVGPELIHKFARLLKEGHEE